MGTVIKVENLSKEYVISHDIKKNNNVQKSTEIFNALRDINFEIKQGEKVGIIGKNGAGKSTLLKILSRITSPTTGKITINGRISSLLEVGTGFHPELTGRENIYLNGSILGMSRREIKNKFDEIVDFSGVEKFLDTPVKRYSSGMYVRLAFAVAAHLDTNILIVDEVLAVGDAPFQKKCLGKISQSSSEGRTVLFVSHQMRVIRSVCSRVLMLEAGRLFMDGATSEVIDHYQNESAKTVPYKSWDIDSPGDDVVKLTEVKIKNFKGELSDLFDVQDVIIIEMQYVVLAEHKYQLTPNFRIFDSNNDLLFFTSDVSDGSSKYDKQAGNAYVSECVIPKNLLSEGMYTITSAVSTVALSKPHFYEEQCLVFEVFDSMTSGGVRDPIYIGEYPGIIRPYLEWSTRQVP